MSTRRITGQHFSGTSERGALSRTHYLDCSFSHMDWQGASLQDVQFERCRFDAVRFQGCAMEEVLWLDCAQKQLVWTGCEAVRCNLLKGSVDGWHCSGGRLQNCNWNALTGTDWLLEQVQAQHCTVVDATLQRVTLQDGAWRDAIWAKSRLQQFDVLRAGQLRTVYAQCQIHQARWHGCSGSLVRWTNCGLEQVEWLDCAIAQAAWSQSQCSECRLLRCQLPQAYFDHSVWQHLQVSDSHLERAMFDGARLSHCDLRALQAEGVSWRGAVLQRVDLRGAQMARADAGGASLQEVDLRAAQVRGASLLGQDHQAWSEADTTDSRFQARSEHDDTLWWQTHQPGVREVLA